MTEALLGEPPSSARDEFTAKHFMAGGHNIIAGAGARVTIGDDPDTLIPVPTEHAPADFVDRPELTTPLLLHLLDDKPTLKGRASVSIVNGMGGIGKTTVVQWMVWQSELERRFPDGRIWVTLGNEPKDGRSIVNACLSKLHRRMPAETPTKDASGDLAAILQTRSVLFVIDDVWPGQSAEVARALIVPSPGSRFLLTSRFRFSELTDEPTLQAKEFPLDEMNIDQGTALIANTLGRQLRGTEKALAKGLCEAVGGHPLALELAAARIKRGRPWGPLIEDLTAEIVRLEVLNKPQSITAGEQPESDLAKRKQHSVIASLTLSVRGLPLFAKQLFAWLGIVFEDAAITPKMCATLWMADEEAARQYLDDLASVSLLRTTKDVYGIHDLMHDMARHLLTAPPVPSQDGEIAGLGLNLRDAHRQFLENYRGKTTNRPWHTLSDDGYIHDHLVRHFEKADLESDLSRLLWEENVDGQCGWYDARERLGQTAGFLADVERVWSYADRIFAGSEDMGARVQAATLQLHCALIIASVNSLSAAIPVALLLGGIRGGVFTLTDALALARRHPEREPRVQALCAVADEISPVEKPIVRAEALAAARGIDDAEGRSRALVEVALRLPVEDQPDMLREALNAAQEIHDASRRSTALARLLELLPPGEALGIVHNIGDQWEEKRENGASTWCSMPMWRPRALAVVARRLTADERLRVVEEALSAARGMDEARWQVAALGAVAQRLAPQEQWKVFDEALATARGIEDAQARVWALVDLAEGLRPEERASVLDEALCAAYRIDDPRRRIRALALAARLLTVEDAPRVFKEDLLSVALSVDDVNWRAMALAAVARRLPPDVRSTAVGEAVAAARHISDPRSKAMVAELLPGREAVAVAREIDDAWWRSVALWVAAKHLALEEQPSVLCEAIRIVHGIHVIPRGYPLSRSRSPSASEKRQLLTTLAEELASVATRLPARERRRVLIEAIKAAGGTNDAEPRARALTGIAELLPAQEALVDEALSVARGIDDAAARSRALAWVARERPVVLREAIDVARTIADQGSRFRAMSPVSHLLSEDERAEFSLAPPPPPPPSPDIKLAKMAEGLPAEEALTVARKINGGEWRAEALAEVAQRLPVEQQASVVSEALTAARGIDWRWDRAQVLAKVAQVLPPEEQGKALSEALAAVRSIDDAGSRAAALVHVAYRLSLGEPTSILGEALTAARAIDDKWERAEALARVAQTAVRGIDDATSRARALAEVTRQLGATQMSDLIRQEWMETVRVLSMRRRGDCIEGMTTVLPLIDAVGGETVVRSLGQSIVSVGKWWP